MIRQAVALALALVVLGAPAGAQDAAADLRAVESGRLDAGRESEFREMCLRGPSAYVLAFERGTDSGEGIAAVQAPSANEILGEPVAVVVLSASGQDRWSWRPFIVHDYTCFALFVQNGRARVYQLQVGMRW